VAFELKDFTGSLFKNQKKTKDTDADYTGTAKLSGDEFWLNAWLNTTGDGRKYLSVKFKPKQQRATSGNDGWL
jgi:hypothetical protein